MVVKESLLRDMLRLFVWYPFRWLVLALPVRIGVALLSLMGDVHYCFSIEKRQRLHQNSLLIKTKGIVKGNFIKEYFRNYYIDRLLIFIFPKFGRQEIERFVEFEGFEYLDQALKKGKGAILVHGHFGPVHLPLVTLARLGYKIKQIGNPSDEGLSWIGRHVAFRLRLIYEKKIPAEIIKVDSFLRPAFTCLQGNGVIMTTGDGSGTVRQVGKQEPFLFLNQKVMFPLGPSRLAYKTDAALLPLFIIPGKRKPYRIIIEPPLLSEKTGDEKIRDLTGQFIERFEYYAILYPEYMHFIDRI
jgi:lauroyl/myristoyl acyltransferase